MPEMDKDLEAWYRQDDDEADETFLEYECGPISWRIKDGIRWVYYCDDVWISEQGVYEIW